MKAIAIKTTIAWFLVSLTLVVLIFGCRSAKINRSVTKTTRDSTAIEKTDSAGIKKKNVVKVTTEDKDRKTVTEITFDTTSGWLYKKSGEIRLDSVLTSKGDTAYVYTAVLSIDRMGNISTTIKPKSIKQTVTDKGKVKDSTVINSSDTAAKTTEKKTVVNDTQSVKTKDKKVTGSGIGFTISIIVCSLALLLFLLWRLKNKLKKSKTYGNNSGAQDS